MKDIKTEELSVTIKVLKVNSRKMTQTVFKQLEEKSIIDDNLNIRGKVWGKVNHFLPKQPTLITNIVWQDDKNLYRSEVKPLMLSAVQAKQRLHDLDFNLYKELPHFTLAKAVEENDENSIEKIISVFERYGEVYKLLRSADQLFIGT